MYIYISLFSLDSWPIDSLDQNAIQTHVKSVSLPPRKDGQNEANNPLLLLVVVRSVESSKRERFSSLRKGRLIPRECDLSLHKRRRAAQNYKRHAVPLAYIYIYVRGKTFPLSWPHARNTQRSPLSTVSLQPRHDFFHENKAILRSFAVHPLPYLTFPLCPTSCTKIYSRQKKGAGKKKNCLDSFLDRRNAIFATENRRSAKKEEVGRKKRSLISERFRGNARSGNIFTGRTRAFFSVRGKKGFVIAIAAQQVRRVQVRSRLRRFRSRPLLSPPMGRKKKERNTRISSEKSDSFSIEARSTERLLVFPTKNSYDN